MYKDYSDMFRNRIPLLITIWLYLLVLSCSNDDNMSTPYPFVTGTDILSIEVECNDGNVYKPFLVDDSLIHIKVPNNCLLNNTILRLNHNGEEASIDGCEIHKGEMKLDFSDFTKQKVVKISSIGKEKNYYIWIYDLPVVIINTPNAQPIESKEIRVENTEVKLVDNEGNQIDLGTGGIRGRGNSTWEAPKKPYNLKLDKKHEILGMPKSKHWIFRANSWMDRTQIHDAVAYEMARYTDFPWVQTGKFVELILNGTPQGLYYLCEKVRVQKDRIDINIMESKDTVDEIEGGYFLESSNTPADNKIQTKFFSITDAGNPLYWEIKEPEDLVCDEVKAKIITEMNRLEEQLFNGDNIKTGKYRDFIDIESAINWWLVGEATVNREIRNCKNIYLYKDLGGGKLFFGPPWDFDAHTFGMSGHNEELICPFYFHEMVKDEVFVNRLKVKWAFLKYLWVTNIPLYIDKLYDEIHRSACRNEQMWPYWDYRYHYPDMNYYDLIMEMKAFLLKQITYVDQCINKL